jgi:hypothetical protein
MISKKDEKKCIRAALILEIIGRPPEHLTATLQEILKQMGEEKGVDVVSKKINEPIPMKEHKDFYTTFAEIEVDVEDMLYVAILIFKYMPAHVEIISPEIIAMKNNGWNDIFNELTRRLHGYDEIARVLGAEKKILENKLREVLKQTSSGDTELREVLGQRAETAKEEKPKKINKK